MNATYILSILIKQIYTCLMHMSRIINYSNIIYFVVIFLVPVDQRLVIGFIFYTRYLFSGLYDTLYDISSQIIR